MYIPYRGAILGTSDLSNGNLLLVVSLALDDP
jgi:hypothetical protein